MAEFNKCKNFRSLIYYYYYFSKIFTLLISQKIYLAQIRQKKLTIILFKTFYIILIIKINHYCMQDKNHLRPRIYSLAPNSIYESTKKTISQYPNTVRDDIQIKSQTNNWFESQKINSNGIKSQKKSCKNINNKSTNKLKGHKQQNLHKNFSIQKIKKISTKGYHKINDDTFITRLVNQTIDHNKNEDLLNKIIQKQKLLRQLEQRIQLKLQQEKKIQKQLIEKFSIGKLEFINLQKKFKIEKQRLLEIQQKTAQFQVIYEEKKQEIRKGKQQLQILIKYIEQKTAKNELFSQQLQILKNDIQKREIQLQKVHQMQTIRQAELVNAELKMEQNNKQISFTLNDLEKKIKKIQEESSEIQKKKLQQFEKQIKLREKQKIIQTYASQLNNCISNISVQRSNLLNINNDLQHRCSQLENLQIKLFQRVSEPNIQNSPDKDLSKYLTKIKTKQILQCTPITKNKQNVKLSQTQKKITKKLSDKNVFNQNEYDMLLDSCNFDSVKLF